MSFFNNLSLKVKLLGGFTLVSGLIVVVSAVVYGNVHRMIDSSKWVNHTYEVIRTAESVAMAMVNMETGQRGFMITGVDEYLEPYEAGKAVFGQLIEQGATLTSDNPAQVERWGRVQDLKNKWLREAAQPEIAARHEFNLGEKAIANFQEISSRTVGKEIFDSIRAALANLENEFRGNQAGIQLVTLTTLDLVNMETGQRGFLLTGKEESLEPYNLGKPSLEGHIKELNQLAAETNIPQRSIDLVLERVNRWVDEAAEPEINARRDMNKHTMTMEGLKLLVQNGPGKSIMDTLRAQIDEIVDAEELLIGIRGAEQQSASDFTVTVSIVGSAIAVIFGMAVAWFITRGVLVPVRATNDILQDIATGDGDLTIRVPVSNSDEIGQMGTNFNAFVEKLQGIIGNIAEATGQLASASEEMAAVMEQTSAGVVNQTQETSQVATAISEMSATAQEVAQSAEGATESAGTANQEAKKGNQVVAETASAITDLANDIESSSSLVEKLKDDTKNIGTVLDVIRGIAEQTNLLALNAAIEAARAGEQGRGFAVVADEVRSLAQRTQESTTEIEALIVKIQDGVGQASEVMMQSRDSAGSCVEQAQTAGSSLSAIANAVEQILQLNTQIAAAAEEQSLASEEVQRSVVNIQSISEETSAGTSQTSKASAELAQLSEKLNGLVGQFRI